MKLLIRDEVVEDVESVKRFIAAVNVEAANRFGPAVLAAWDVLLTFPCIGRPRTFKRLAGVRSWRVPGFKNHLIFYRVNNEVVDVLAVLEGHRDLAAVLETPIGNWKRRPLVGRSGRRI